MQPNQLSTFVLVSGAFLLAFVTVVYGAPPSQNKAVAADDALKDLMDGNARFAKGEAISPRRSPADFRAASAS